MIIEPRPSVSIIRAGLAPIWAILFSMALCAVLIAWAGASIPTAYALLFKGAFGSAFAINETLTRSIPLIFTGLAASIAFRAKFYNIGAEGQLYAGALAATYFGTGLIILPSFLMVPFLVIMGALAGGLLLLIPVLFKNQIESG